MKKIRIAHDIHDFLESSDTFLSRNGFTVFAAATNDELLKLHRAKRADLIITKLEACPLESFLTKRKHSFMP